MIMIIEWKINAEENWNNIVNKSLLISMKNHGLVLMTEAFGERALLMA